MSCPTCDHTLDGLGEANERKLWHCKRCGTVVAEAASGWRDVYAPMLVYRCRRFENYLPTVPAQQKAWVALGIADSINLPGTRSYE